MASEYVTSCSPLVAMYCRLSEGHLPQISLLESPFLRVSAKLLFRWSPLVTMYCLSEGHLPQISPLVFAQSPFLRVSPKLPFRCSSRCTAHLRDLSLTSPFSGSFSLSPLFCEFRGSWYDSGFQTAYPKESEDACRSNTPYIGIEELTQEYYYCLVLNSWVRSEGRGAMAVDTTTSTQTTTVVKGSQDNLRRRGGWYPSRQESKCYSIVLCHK